MKVSILVVIATYNRPQSLLKALKSIDHQDYDNFSILISDNSPNSETEKLMKDVRLSHNYEYIHREPQPNGIAHFNIILKELPKEYDYFMICHDDDTLREGAISSVARLAEQYPSCVAICSNGYKVRENGKIIGKFVKPDGNRVISSKKELAEKYLKEKGLPFPAILYKMITSTVLFDISKGGKYCDSVHTIDLLEIGPILWASENMILNYRVGASQDSSVLVPNQRRKLLRYLTHICNVDYRFSSDAKKFRLNDIYSYYCSNSKVFGRKLFLLFLLNGYYILYLKALIKNVIIKL